MPENNHGQEPDSSQGNEPKFVTEDVLNKAITARLSQLEKKQKEQLAEALNSLAPMLDKALEDKLAAKPQDPPSKKDRNSVEDDPQFKGLKKELAELKAKADAAEAKAAQEAAKAKEAALRQKVADELGKHGIDSQRARHAMSFIVDAERRVRYDDDDNLVFRDSDGQELDLMSGVKAWVKSDDAKIYLPPKGASGSGDRPAKTQIRDAKGQITREAIGNELMKKIFTE